ncbi:DNA methylase [Shewanella algae]|uniref:DNA methylase n=1 Tax=Shewanella algae TaxID=38313 RepID=A0A379Z3F9_9GAMM|nr:DNA methylase [Shewanella algae]
MGSGSTGKACKALGRSFIGIELDEEIFNQVRAALEQIPGDSERLD